MLYQLIALVLINTTPEPIDVHRDLQWFPNHSISMYQYNSAREAKINAPYPQAWQHPFKEHYEYYNYVQFKFKAWDYLTNAQLPNFSQEAKLQNLEKLRSLIGYENYYYGIMPQN